MGARIKSRIVLGFLCLIGFWVTTLIQPALQAQEITGPPALLGRIDSFDIERPTATAFSIWNASRDERHQVWFRVMGGDALFQQRLRVYKEQALPRSPETLPPQSRLLYEIEGNQASDWFFLGTENEFHTYYFDGDNRPFGDPIWDNAKAVRAKATAYQNGDLYEISFEDLNTLDDYNDLEIEVILFHSQAGAGF